MKPELLKYNPMLNKFISNGIKSNFKLVVKYLTPFAALVLPFVAWAADPIQTGLGGIQDQFPRSGIAGTTSLTGRGGLIAVVISTMLLIAGAIAVVFVIIGGYQYLTSAGNEESAEKGKKTLINAIIGIVVIILAYAIISVIVNQVSSR